MTVKHTDRKVFANKANNNKNISLPLKQNITKRDYKEYDIRRNWPALSRYKMRSTFTKLNMTQCAHNICHSMQARYNHFRLADRTVKYPQTKPAMPLQTASKRLR